MSKLLQVEHFYSSSDYQTEKSVQTEFQSVPNYFRLLGYGILTLSSILRALAIEEQNYHVVKMHGHSLSFTEVPHNGPQFQFIIINFRILWTVGVRV